MTRGGAARRERESLPGGPITLDRLDDPIVEGVGEHVTSPYVETFWLPRLGPSATWMLRLAARLTVDGPVEIDPDVLGRSLGISGPHGAARALARLVDFYCAVGGHFRLRLQVEITAGGG